MSFGERPALDIAFGIAKEGAVVNSIGAFSASASPIILARGVNPRLMANLAVVKTSAAPPSFSGDAFAAVTVPSGLKTGFKVGTLAAFNFLIPSSSVIIFFLL